MADAFWPWLHPVDIGGSGQLKRRTPPGHQAGVAFSSAPPGSSGMHSCSNNAACVSQRRQGINRLCTFRLDVYN